ncbi:hypothetical protein [Dongia sp.]|uniref:hypothetical protein n=1 Tax=Dongia sp. TaxID=1977262 RepID=UPI0035B08A43
MVTLVAHDVVSLIPSFCDAFRGVNAGVEGGMMAWSKTDHTAYDYSVDSLMEVDRYLDAIRPIKDQVDWQVYTNTVLVTGAYIGEVLRRHGDKPWEWMNFSDFLQQHGDLAVALEISGEELHVAAFLVADRSVTLPFNKVMRNLEEGPENSIHFYVTATGAGD